MKKSFLSYFFMMIFLLPFLFGYSCNSQDSGSGGGGHGGKCEEVKFADINLETVIRDAIGKPTGKICKSSWSRCDKYRHPISSK